jgi:hypothetical protein
MRSMVEGAATYAELVAAPSTASRSPSPAARGRIIAEPLPYG